MGVSPGSQGWLIGRALRNPNIESLQVPVRRTLVSSGLQSASQHNGREEIRCASNGKACSAMTG